jgi:single-strand DNA-binding protein
MEAHMAGVNKAILIGNLGRDPELRRTPQGSSVASFSLATTERRTDRNGQRQEYTEWHNVVAWGKLAELVNQYLKKGRTAYVEGRIATRSWDDRDGNKRYRTEIVANTIQFLGSPSGQASKGRTDDVPPPEDFDMPGNEAGNEAGSEAGSGADGSAPAEDDLPF